MDGKLLSFHMQRGFLRLHPAKYMVANDYTNPTSGDCIGALAISALGYNGFRNALATRIPSGMLSTRVHASPPIAIGVFMDSCRVLGMPMRWQDADQLVYLIVDNWDNDTIIGNYTSMQRFYARVAQLQLPPKSLREAA